MRRRALISGLAAAATWRAVGAAFAAEAAEHGEAAEPASFNHVIFQAINLAILLFILVKYAKDPIRRSLTAR